MPDPQSPSANVEPDSSREIDLLVRRAMTGGGTHELRSALERLQEERAAIGPQTGAPAADGGGESPFDRLITAATAARSQWSAADMIGARQALDEAAAALESARTELPVAPIAIRAAPPAVVLPPFRHEYALIVNGLADSSRAGELAQALGVDGVTAQQLAISRHPRVALRSGDAEQLQGRVTQMDDALHLMACVVSRATLLDIDAPRAVLSGGGRPPTFRVAAGVAWHGAPEAPPPGAGEGLALPEILLAVPGDVVLLRSRAARQGGRLKHLREGKERDSGERRVAVVDLHGPKVFLRIVEGITDLSALPGHHPSSFRRSLKGLFEALPELFAGIHTVGARVCRPVGRGPAADPDSTVRVRDGWPTWEEHTRCCRLLMELGGSVATRG